MRKVRSPLPSLALQGGFTLLEVMVALVVAVLILGGVMGLYSSSLKFQYRINKKSQVMPLLESVAQQILMDPTAALKGSVDVGDGQAPVRIAVAKAIEDDGQGLGKTHAHLHRVQLLCEGQMLELSVLIPETDQ